MSDSSAVETRLRAMLERHAGDAPTGAGMLTAVRHVSRRRARRRRVAVAGLLAVMVCATSGLGVAFWWPPVGPGPAEPAASATTVALIAGPTTITVPFTLPPPDGYLGSLVTIVAGRPVLTFTSEKYASLGAITVTLVADLAEVPPAARSGDSTRRDWTEAGGDEVERLWWLPLDGQWLRVASPARYPEAALTRFRSGLTRVPMRLPAPMLFDLVPEGFVLDNLDVDRATFCPPGVQPGTATAGKLVVTWAKPRPADRPANGQSMVEGPTTAGGLTTVTITSDAGTTSVQVPAEVPLSAGDLLRFAAGVHH